MTAKTRVISLERLETILEGTYPEIRCRIEEGGLSIFSDFPTDRQGYLIAEYYAGNEIGYDGGIRSHFKAWAERKGYWVEWQNPEHIKLWKI